MTEPLIVDTCAVLQAQYTSHTLRKVAFRRAMPAPAPKAKGKRKDREEGEDESRELTRSEKEGMARHRAVAPWLYITAHLVCARWPAPPALTPEEQAMPSLHSVSTALRSWAPTEALADAKEKQGEEAGLGSAVAVVEYEGDALSLSGLSPSTTALFHRLYRHTGAQDALITLSPHTFVLPPFCAFFLSHAPYLGPLVRSRPPSGYALVVADPPWENASARRAAVYQCMAPHELRAMPIAQLVAPRAYVAIWVTNKEDLIRFACKTLLPTWGASHVATVLWLKLTDSGQLVCPIDPERALSGGAPHRPYETLVIGRVGPASPQIEALEARLLHSRVIVSDAGRRHSRKPPLDELFKPLLSALIGLPSAPACLELFARELRAGWTSWGNEVLLFQEREGNFD